MVNVATRLPHKGQLGASAILRQRGCRNLLLLRGLLGGLGDLAALARGLLDALDDTDSDGLAHVTDGETAQRRVLVERLNAHGLRRDHLDDSSVTRLDELWVLLKRLTRATVDLLEDVVEAAGNVSRVAAYCTYQDAENIKNLQVKCP